MPAPRRTRALGNSHMLMQDRNNLQVADPIARWIDARVEQKARR